MGTQWNVRIVVDLQCVIVLMYFRKQLIEFLIVS